MKTIETQKFILILYIFFVMLKHTISLNTNYSNKEISPFTQIAVADQTVYIGGAGGIVSLNLTTSSDNLISNHSNVWLLLHWGDIKDIIYCYNNIDHVSHCTKRDQQFLADESYNISLNITYLPVYSLITMKCVNRNIGIILLGSMSNGILSLNLTDMKLSVLHPFKAGTYVVFKSSFVYNASYVYFFFQIFETSGQYKSSKIGKLCLNYIADETDINLYSAFEDMELSCAYKNKTFKKIEHGISFDKVILVVFRENNTSVICFYNQSDVNKRFIDLRKQFCMSNNRTWIHHSQICFQQENVCNRNYSHTFESTTGIENKNPVYAGKDVITSVDIIYHDNKVIVTYIGTEDGRIGKIRPCVIHHDWMRNAGFQQIDTTKIIRIKTGQNHIQALSSNKFQKIKFQPCPSCSNCESCMESLDPNCGWDYKTKKCIPNKQNSDVWIPSTIGFCAKLFGLNQQIIIDDEKNTINFTIRMPQKMEIICRNHLKCSVGKIDGCDRGTDLEQCKIELKDLHPGQHNFSIQCKVNQKYVVVAQQNVAFLRCTDILTCTECTNLIRCFWLPETFSCNKFGNGSGIMNKKDCPRIENNNQLMLHANISTNVTIGIANFAFVQPILECEIWQNNIPNRTFNAILSENRTFVLCLGLYLETTAPPYTIRLKNDKNRYVDNEVKLKVYSCSGLSRDKESCGECQLWIKQGYDCQWCVSDPKCYHCKSDNGTPTCSVPKCIPIVKKISPQSGPMMGGTFVTIIGQNLGTHGYNISVDLNGVRCNNWTIVQPFNSLTCVTGKSNTTKVTGIFVSVNETQFNDSSIEYNYMYKIPSIDKFSPEKGIVAGNTTITIKGSNICFKGKHRYTISLCDSTKSCIPCSVPSEFECRNASIRVKTLPALCPRNMTTLKFGIDDFTAELYTQRFEYLPDPTFIFSNHTPKSLQSGGATFTINGEGFSHVGEITVERVKNPCDVKLDIQAVCQTPEKKQNESNVQSVPVYFDGLTVTVDIEYVDDPQFNNFQSILEYNKESPIKITGTNILHGAIYDDYSIHVGLDGKCIIKDISMTYIICLPPTFTPRTNETDEHTVFVVVEVGRIKAYIGKLRYKVDIDILAIIVGLLAAAFVIAVVVGVFTVFIMKKKKRKVIKEFKLELLTREEMIRKASREEFADAQMTMREIKSDLVTSRVPFRDYQTYVLYQLFPNQDIETNPLLHDSKLTDNQEPKMKNALEKFDQLLSNKVFLKTLVQTLDRKNMLTMQEKAHFSSVLSIALLGNMRLLFDLVNCLLADMIHSSTKKQHKVLFRRFDSITIRLMANWLQIGLYGQLTAHSGMHLFMLYKAVQTIIEMSPIDALTGNAKNTIAEEKLLKMRIEHQSLTLQIDLNGNSDEHYPVRVLDCDTISQVKQKCCAQIYKNKPASERPRNDELTLEWQEGSAGKLILDDIDNISETGNGLVRLNTLKHYMVKDNCKMALMYNHHDDQEVYVNSATFRTESMASEDITLLMPDRNEQENVEIQKWHLETFSSNLPDDEKSNREADFGDIFLNRLFHTKLLLSDYVDSTFEGLLDPQTASVSIRYFLWMLDKLGQDAGVEEDVLQSWKNECYATRVWAPLIGKPDILFDVMDTEHVEPCMDILRQVFVESCTQTTHKISKESSTQKLLFHKDIPRYRKLIGAFFMKLEPVSDQDFWSEMDECSNQQKAELTFSRQATLHQLYNLFIGNYKNEIMEDFEDMEESKDLQFASKLQEIIELMDESSI